ncbi:signal recognition particle-docking protein FtsY [Thiospirillum jenense]|uniref:Signal recognition particle receptor FtsY n=1 Tax=Thiospirillum jenense TaxID=1653858 RepID=A0A839HDU0_9GAMM|nr:signal recognition particle-docking protein FtsY [Thiospirillum jenense]MBB1125179.1 signal recognition particle-docking protein FtsY [Thiospirillum jenense]
MFGFGKKKQPLAASSITTAPIAPPEPPASMPVVENTHLAANEVKLPKTGLLTRLRERLRHDTTPTAPALEAPSPVAKLQPVVELQPKVIISVTEPVPAPPMATTSPAASRILAAAQQVRENATATSGGVLSNLRERLARTRAVLTADVGDLLRGRKEIDAALLEELETLLLTADVGVPATTRIIADLTAQVQRHELARPAALVAALRDELRALVLNSTAPVRQPQAGHPQVILMVGVNGVGKTTTIGKLARQLQLEGNHVMLAAGDTFRAAAVEQLQVWGERNQVTVIAQAPGADPAAVIFDALQAATARGMDVLIADTAGRLHTKLNLMEELKKIVRVMKKLDPDAPHEVMLVVDATTGQNALHQAQEFNRAVPLTGITLTKLDGTAKGGVLFALVDALKVPIRFIGVGEAIEDLRYFQAEEFLDALLSP